MLSDSELYEIGAVVLDAVTVARRARDKARRAGHQIDADRHANRICALLSGLRKILADDIQQHRGYVGPIGTQDAQGARQ